jgi:branched-chain amino acid transport system substrate-binding protein
VSYKAAAARDEGHGSGRDGRRRPAWITPRRLGAVGLLTLALVLAAGASPANRGGARPILKIGLSAPFTGWDEALGYEVIHAVRLALRERNQAGGAGGYSIELAALDDRNEPAETAQQVRELAVDPDILGAVGGLDNEAMLTAAPEVHKAGLPFVVIGGTAAALTEQGYAELFRLAPRDEAVASVAVSFAVQALQAKRLVLIRDRAEEGLATAFTAAARGSGLPMVSTIEVRRWQLDFSVQVEELGARQADVVFFAGRVSEAGPLLGQAKAAGLRFALLGGPALDDARLSQLAGAGLEPAAVVGLAALDPASPFSAGYIGLAGKAPNARAALAYDATGLLLDAIGRAASGGRPTRPRVLAELAKTQGYKGVTGPITFDRKGDNTLARAVVYQLGPRLYPGTPAR